MEPSRCVRPGVTAFSPHSETLVVNLAQGEASILFSNHPGYLYRFNRTRRFMLKASFWSGLDHTLKVDVWSWGFNFGP